MTPKWTATLWIGCMACVTGCVPGERLHFENVPPIETPSAIAYDTDGNGAPDFALLRDRRDGRLDELAYDDNEDGTPDRRYRLSDYANDEVPHLVVLIDSVPYPAIVERLRDKPDSVLAAFFPPAKVIAPYPSMSAVCFSAMLHAPPMPGPINRHYDPRPQHNAVNNLIRKRFDGFRNPWQQRLHYNIDYRDNGTAFLEPRPWMKVEFERARRAFDASPDRTTLVYISSTAALMFQDQHVGLRDALDDLEKFIVQVLYERRGAVKVSVLSDHGHNLVDTTWIDVEQTLADAGFRVTDKLRRPGDVFVEMDGLLTWFGVHTEQPEAVADALLAGRPELETVSYVVGRDVVVRNHEGAAVVSMDDQRRLTYRPDTADVLGYGDELSNQPMSRDEWFARTADHEFPDAPARLWDGFRRGTLNVPQVMVSVRDGYCAGIEWFQWFVTPRSTHGGLNQVNSAAFVMSMRGPIDGPLRSAEVMNAIQPGFIPPIVSGDRR